MCLLGLLVAEGVVGREEGGLSRGQQAREQNDAGQDQRRECDQRGTEGFDAE